MDKQRLITQTTNVWIQTFPADAKSFRVYRFGHPQKVKKTLFRQRDPIGDKQEISTCLFIFVSNQKLCTTYCQRIDRFEELHQNFKGIWDEKGRMTWIYGRKEFNRKMEKYHKNDQMWKVLGVVVYEEYLFTYLKLIRLQFNVNIKHAHKSQNCAKHAIRATRFKSH